MRNVLAAAIVGGLMLMGAGAAQAQLRPASEGINCVYDAIVEDDYYLVAEVVLYDDMTEEEISQATQMVETAKKECAAQFAFTEGQLYAIAELAVYTSAMDYLVEELLFSGADEEAVDDVQNIYDGFTDEEFEKLFDADWRSDAAFYGKVKTQLVDAGIPDESFALDAATTILEIAALADSASALFLQDEAKKPASN